MFARHRRPNTAALGLPALYRAAPVIGARNTYPPVAIIAKNDHNELWTVNAPTGGADTTNPYTQGCTLGTLVNGDFGYGYTENGGGTTTNFQIPVKNAVNLSDATNLGGHARDVILAGPGHPWNGQAGGLDREGGIVVVNAGHVLGVGFTWAPSVNYVAQRGGVGQNADGLGYMCQSNRAMKVQGAFGTVHLEGFSATGVLYEFYNQFSSDAAAGGVSMQRYYVGPIVAKLIDQYGKMYGDAGYVAGAHDGGDKSQIQNTAGAITYAQGTVDTGFQAYFHDNVSGGSPSIQPTSRSFKQVEVLGSSSGNSEFFFREGTPPITPTVLDEVFYEGPNTHYSGAAGTGSMILYMSGKATSSGTVTGGAYDGRQLLTLEAGSNTTGGVMIGRRTPGDFIAPPARVGLGYNPRWSGWQLGAAAPTTPPATPPATGAGFGSGFGTSYGV